MPNWTPEVVRSHAELVRAFVASGHYMPAKFVLGRALEMGMPCTSTYTLHDAEFGMLHLAVLCRSKPLVKRVLRNAAHNIGASDIKHAYHHACNTHQTKVAALIYRRHEVDLQHLHFTGTVIGRWTHFMVKGTPQA